MWRRHVHPPPPSRHAIRATCMQLLPLVEMFCKWELEEDCSNLRALMLRFDSELELESHELGRSLLFMVRDDGIGIESVPRLVPIAAPADPFRLVRERLAVVGSAIHGLHHQVHPYWWIMAFPLCLCLTPALLCNNLACIHHGPTIPNINFMSHQVHNTVHNTLHFPCSRIVHNLSPELQCSRRYA